ncbi:hypothetical protein TNCV_2084811 [Trichonephila clavipes]|uniref:Uncharacterized protein n=1 Tax=Trichonephila clavipes TaxID=2585209 RepID=A0A8X6RQV2_TRICX|nr:hypothetical protein TNCV_2084811 [Trichonephila clavipes]
MSSPEFKPRPYGTAVSVANHYTGWATSKARDQRQTEGQLTAQYKSKSKCFETHSSVDTVGNGTAQQTFHSFVPVGQALL